MIKNKTKSIIQTAGKIASRLLPSRKHWAVMGLLFFGIAVVGFALSAEGTAAAFLSAVGEGIAYGLAWLATALARLFLAMAIFFMRFFLQLGAYNGYLDAPAVKIGWVMVRDVANMFFVVALLVIAFATILGRESYEWKKTMAKLILAAIFVNFSMMITGIMIDAVHVFTVTFLNAIIPVAGGNLINMFNLTEIRQMVAPGEDLGIVPINLEIFLGAVFSAMFAGMTMVIMAAYAGIMLFRMVFLWVLIIMSPLAYIFSVLPATQKLASEWWDEFTKYLLVAPIMVFFMWLSFASLGAGDAARQLNDGSTVGTLKLTEEPEAAIRQGQSSSFNLGTTWSNMAAYLIALAFLYTGVDRVQRFGVKGSEWAKAGIDFGKKVGGVVSGAAAARWAGKGAWTLAKKGVKKAAWHAPLIGGEKWVNRAKSQWDAVRHRYYGKGAGAMSGADIDKTRELNRLDAELGETDNQLRIKILADIDTLQEERDELADKPAASLTTTEQERLAELDTSLADRVSRLGTVGEEDPDRDAKIARKEELEGQLAKSAKKRGKGLIAAAARSSMRLEKRAEKTKEMADKIKETLKHRVERELGGYIPFVGSTRGSLAAYQDRMEQGWHEAEEMRSQEQTNEHKEHGKNMTLGQARYKEGDWREGRLVDEIAGSKMAAEHFQTATQKLESEAQLKIVANFEAGQSLDKLKKQLANLKIKQAEVPAENEAQRKNFEAKIAKKEAEIDQLIRDEGEEGQIKMWQSASGIGYNQFINTQALGKVTEDTVAALKQRFSEARVSKIYSVGLDASRLAGEWESGVYHDDAARAEIKAKRVAEETAEKKMAEQSQNKIKAEFELTDLNEDLELADTGELISNLEARIASSQKAKTAAETASVTIANALVTKEAELALAATDEIKAPIQAEITRLNTEKERVDTQTNTAQEKINESRTKLDHWRGIADPRVEIQAAIDEAQANMVQLERNAKEAQNEYAEAKTDRITLTADYERQADVLRQGGAGANEILQERSQALRVEAETLTAEEDKKKRATIINKAKKLEELSDNLKNGGSLAFQYGAAVGRQKDVSREHQYNHNDLLSEAEQRVVFHKRGISTPSSALTEIVEQFEQDFREMSYDEYVKSVGDMFEAYLDKQEEGEEITVADRAAMMGLFRRGFKESWVDDAIIGIMKNDNTRGRIGSLMGWIDNSFTSDKVSDAVSMFQTAGDVNYTKKLVPFRELLDQVSFTEELEWDIPSLLENVGNGVNLQALAQEKGVDLRGNITESLQNMGRRLTQEQKELLDAFIEGEASGVSGAVQEVAKNFATDFVSTAQDYQASFQYMGNLRNEAIANGHVENSGHALYQDVGGGQTMYVGAGVWQARQHGYGDFNKTDTRKRVSSHPHVAANLDGNTQVSIGVREKDFGMKFGGVASPKDISSITSRDVNVLTGIGAVETAAKYRDSQGRFNAAKSKQTQEAWKLNQAARYKRFSAKANARGQASQEQIDAAFAARNVVMHDYLPAMRGNVRAALMIMAANSDLDQYKAGNQGAMNLTLPVYDEVSGEVKEKHIGNIDEFLSMVSGGEFGQQIGSLPSFSGRELTEEELAEQTRRDNEGDDTGA